MSIIILLEQNLPASPIGLLQGPHSDHDRSLQKLVKETTAAAIIPRSLPTQRGVHMHGETCDTEKE